MSFLAHVLASYIVADFSEFYPATRKWLKAFLNADIQRFGPDKVPGLDLEGHLKHEEEVILKPGRYKAKVVRISDAIMKGAK